MTMLPIILAWVAADLAQPARLSNPASEITPPILMRKVEPEYTPDARTRGMEGVVKLHAEITARGAAANVQVLRSLDPGLDARAVQALRQWRFRPAERDGKPVTVTAAIEVEFRLPRYPALPSSSPRPDATPLNDDDWWIFLW